MATISVNGISLSYDTYKIGEQKCFLFLHGLQSDKSLFNELRKTFAAHYHASQLAIDCVGFGDSDTPLDFDYALESQEKLIRKVIEELGIKSLYIVGHSMGGMIGTLMLQTMPDRLISLISLEGNLSFEDCSESKTVAALAFEDFKTNYYPQLKNKLQISQEPSSALRCQALKKTPDYVFYHTSQSIAACAKNGKLKTDFESSPLPKLMICGAQSSFHSRHPYGATHSEIPNSGHFMLSDNLPDTTKAMIDFVSLNL
jgi:pimeloyl-ACP methyl ester carboxylesterase